MGVTAVSMSSSNTAAVGAAPAVDGQLGEALVSRSADLEQASRSSRRVSPEAAVQPETVVPAAAPVQQKPLPVVDVSPQGARRLVSFNRPAQQPRRRPAVSNHRIVAQAAPERARTYTPPRVVKAAAAQTAAGGGYRFDGNRGQRVAAWARAQIGKPYRFGAVGPRSFDCSGLTLRAYASVGKRLPRQSDAQGSRGHRVSRSQARPGDLVAWRGHVGVYAGGGRVIHAPKPGDRVKIAKLWGAYRIKRVL